jgi:hypothetical protein
MEMEMSLCDSGELEYDWRNTSSGSPSMRTLEFVLTKTYDEVALVESPNLSRPSVDQHKFIFTY